MKKSKIPYLFSEGIKGLYRNKVLTVTSVLILAACIAVVGVFIILIDVIENNLSKSDELYVITAYLSSDAEEEMIMSAKSSVTKLDNVTDVVYISKEEALLELKGESSDISAVVDEYSAELSSYIRARFEVTFDSYDGLNALVYSLENIETIETVNTKLDLYHGISNLRKAVTSVSTGLIVLLFIVAVFVTLNTVRIGIYYRRDEISLMRYMGATKAFITSPYIIECFFMGAVSVIVALLGEYFLYTYAIRNMITEYGIEGLASFSNFVPEILPAFLLVGIFASSLSGAICVKKYLNV